MTEYTDINGDYLFQGASAVQPITWGGIKLNFSDEKDKSPNIPTLEQDICDSCSDSLLINFGPGANPNCWSARVPIQIDGNTVFNGMLPSNIVEIPNGWDTPGPQMVPVSAFDVKDFANVGDGDVPSYDSPTPLDPGHMPYQCFANFYNPNMTQDLYNARMALCEKMESCSGIDWVYDFQPFFAEPTTGFYWLMFDYDTVPHSVPVIADGYIVRNTMFVPDADENVAVHEDAGRGVNGNVNANVTGRSSVFGVPAQDVNNIDVGVWKIYHILNRAEYYGDTDIELGNFF